MVKKPDQTDILSNTFIRYLLITTGTLFLGIGLIGIIVPILPTTPFLLLAAACYARSSKKFYDLLMNNKWFGTYITNYRTGKGVPLKLKVFTISLLWITILTSIFFFIHHDVLDLVLLIIASGVTIHIFTIKTYK